MSDEQAILKQLNTERDLAHKLRDELPAILKEAGCDEKTELWGVPMGEPSNRRDVLLAKFVRARESVYDEARVMLKDCLLWRRECNVDGLMEVEFPEPFQGHDEISGVDLEGRPILISKFGGMDLKQVFGDVEVFVRYRVQWMERACRMLTFQPNTPETLCQIHDYTGVSLFPDAFVKNAVRAVTKIFSDNYPELKGRTIFTNFPSVFVAMFNAFSVFIPQKTRDKFVMLSPGEAHKMLDWIAPHVLPECYGGLRGAPVSDKLGDTPTRSATISAWNSETVESVKIKAGQTVYWQVRVQWDVIKLVVKAGEATLYDAEATETVGGEFIVSADCVLTFEFNNKAAYIYSKSVLFRALVQ